MSLGAPVRKHVAVTAGRIVVAAAISSALAFTVTLDLAHPHSHKNADGTLTSWYPPECCRDGDCRPVATMTRAPQGIWLTTVDGYTALVGPRDRWLPSRDMRWHLCVSADIETQSDKVTCVFEPSNS